MKKRKRYLFGTAIAAMLTCGVFFFSCEKDEISPNQYTPQISMEENSGFFKGESEEKANISQIRDNCGAVVYRPLVTEGGQPIGRAAIYNNNEVFYVKLVVDRDYYIAKAFAHIAYDADKFPLNKLGNPDFDKFDYNEYPYEPTHELYFKVPYDKIELKQFLGSVMCVIYSSPDRPGENMHAWIQGRPYGETEIGKIFAYSTKKCREIDNGFADDNAEL